MAQEVYNIQRTSDGKVLQGNGSPNSFPNPNNASSWNTSDLDTNFRIPVDYTRSLKQDYGTIEYYVDQLPGAGEIYRLNNVIIV